MKKRSKRYKTLKKIINDKNFNFDNAINELKKLPVPKLPESIDVSFKINLKKVKVQIIV